MTTTETKAKPAKYKWWKDKKMIGTILLIISIILLIFSFVKVPGVSTINAYTIGMLLGFYSPFFYGFTIFIALTMVFGEKIKIPSWFKLNGITYWIVALSIVFISSSTGFYQSKVGFTSFGGKAWSSLDYWFQSFTDNETVSAWVPKNTNGGLIGALFFAILSTLVSGIGTLIIAIIALTVTVSFLITGSGIGLYREMIKKKKVELTQKEIVDNRNSDISNFEDENEIEEIDDIEEIKDEKQKEDDISFPFDDPF